MRRVILPVSILAFELSKNQCQLNTEASIDSIPATKNTTQINIDAHFIVLVFLSIYKIHGRTLSALIPILGKV